MVEVFFREAKLDRPAERAQDVVNFEKSFAKIFPPPAEMRQRFSAQTYWPREQFATVYPTFNFPEFFKKIPSEVQVRNISPESLNFVNETLQTGSLEQAKNLFLFHSLVGVMDDAYPKFFKEYFNFRKKHLGGPDQRPSRDERCTLSVMHHFDMELDEELLPILFPDFPDQEVVALAQKVREAIGAGIGQNSWLSPGAKAEALKKITTARLKLVKPRTEEEWNFTPLRTYDPLRRVTNSITVEEASLSKTYADLKGPRHRERWDMGPLTLNAYYSSEDNQFVLLQGILQYPFFDKALSPIENTGAIGAIVGHELGHSIDDQGSKFDSDGKLREWMTTKDLAEFSRRGQGFVERFNKIGHNGALTLGENIGDHVGLTFAFEAAFPDAAKATAEDLKKFYVAFARMWCHVERPDYLKMHLKTDPHASGTARVNQQVIHQTGFYRAFECKEGDKMFVKPEDRVRIW